MANVHYSLIVLGKRTIWLRTDVSLLGIQKCTRYMKCVYTYLFQERLRGLRSNPRNTIIHSSFPLFPLVYRVTLRPARVLFVANCFSKSFRPFVKYVLERCTRVYSAIGKVWKMHPSLARRYEIHSSHSPLVFFLTSFHHFAQVSIRFFFFPYFVFSFFAIFRLYFSQHPWINFSFYFCNHAQSSKLFAARRKIVANYFEISIVKSAVAVGKLRSNPWTCYRI